MLILSRKENQKIRVGNDIVINVISISEGNVKIGIEANKDIKIFREEIYDSIKQQTMLSANKIKDAFPADIGNLGLNTLNKRNAKK